jgi:putative chitinase
MTDWSIVLKQVAPGGAAAILGGVADAMPTIVHRCALATPLLQAHFLAQTAEESAGYHALKEYASGREYEGRRDLGNTHPGDGVRYKGRGVIETTGRANYAAASKFFMLDFVVHPELLETFPYAALSAAFYWTAHRINIAAARDDIRSVTRLINGGFNGLAAREVYLKRAKKALAA